MRAFLDFVYCVYCLFVCTVTKHFSRHTSAFVIIVHIDDPTTVMSENRQCDLIPSTGIRMKEGLYLHKCLRDKMLTKTSLFKTSIISALFADAISFI